MATQLDFLFEKGTFDERWLICKTVFKNLYVKESKITRAELNTPFAIIAAGSKGSESVLYGGPWGTLPELLFEKKQLIPALQQLITANL